jgi:two-component system response regulator NreC
VGLEKAVRTVSLSVQDNGRGFQAGRTRGLGLLGMSAWRNWAAACVSNRLPATAPPCWRSCRCDTHPDRRRILRSGLRLLLKQEPDLEVVAEAGDGEEAVELMNRSPAEVVVMDVGMPLMNGIEAASAIARRHPRTGMVMLSMHSDETYVLRCLCAGARGYVLKEAAEHELIAAIHAVAAGRNFFSPKVRRLLKREDVRPAYRPRARGTATGGGGSRNKEIAENLHLSVYTVETHRKNIANKLDIHGTADLILYAVGKGLAV